MRDFSPGLWVCGTCGRKYDANADGTWNQTVAGDIASDLCLCAKKPQPGSHPVDSPLGDENQIASRIVREATGD